MKICSELTPITPRDSEYSALIHLCSSKFDRTWAKLSCLSHKYCTPYLTSDVFTFLRGAWNSFNNPYTNAGKGYSFKAELHFGYFRDKNAPDFTDILDTSETKPKTLPTSQIFLYALAGGPLWGFIICAFYLRVNTILHTNPIEITGVSTELESFMQVRNSTRNDFLEKDVTPSITFTEILELRFCAVGTGLTTYVKKLRKKRWKRRQSNNTLTLKNTTVLTCASVPCLTPNK
jgi:hypothetical protein